MCVLESVCVVFGWKNVYYFFMVIRLGRGVGVCVLCM